MGQIWTADCGLLDSALNHSLIKHILNSLCGDVLGTGEFQPPKMKQVYYTTV